MMPSSRPNIRRKDTRKLIIQCPGPSCEACLAKKAVKLVNGKILCAHCAEKENAHGN